MGYAELCALTEDEHLLKEEVHRMARDVVRPAGVALDAMTPPERVIRGSPYFSVMAELHALGYHRLLLPPEHGGPDPALSATGRAIVFEELGWASLGLASAFGVDMLPFVLISSFGSPALQSELLVPWAEDTTGALRGCWAVTEPDHGSDALGLVRDPDAARFGAGQVLASRADQGWVISGQKAGWVSSAPVATHCALHAQDRSSPDMRHGIFAVVALEADGVRRGPPLDMLGARDDPQGELFFDAVRIPDHHIVVGDGPFYPVFLDQLLCLTSAGVAAMAVGVARAAFEEALAYARTRVQGGRPIAGHKNVALTLYGMFEKIETARAYVRQVMAHVTQASDIASGSMALPRHARAAQVYAKRIAFEVAHDALQVHGAIGLSAGAPIQKLFRDARSLLIEDGTLEVLALDAAADIVAHYEEDRYRPEEVMSRW